MKISLNTNKLTKNENVKRTNFNFPNIEAKTPHVLHTDGLRKTHTWLSYRHRTSYKCNLRTRPQQNQVASKWSNKRKWSSTKFSNHGGPRTTRGPNWYSITWIWCGWLNVKGKIHIHEKPRKSFYWIMFPQKEQCHFWFHARHLDFPLPLNATKTWQPNIHTTSNPLVCRKHIHFTTSRNTCRCKQNATFNGTWRNRNSHSISTLWKSR